MRHLSGRTPTVAGGLLLGLLLAAVLLTLNVMGVHIDDRDPPPRAAPTGPRGEPLTGNQPELTRALLSTADLDGRHTPAPSAPPTPAGPPRTAPSSRSAAPPPPAAPADRVERCRTLFSAPWELMSSGHEVTGRADSLINPHTSGGTGAGAPALRQALSLFADDGAAAAYEAIRTSVTDCQTFETTLEDGTLATISLHELEVADGDADGACAVRITALSGTRAFTGYLAIGRVGSMVSVLRTVGPEGTVDAEDAGLTLDMAIDKMALLGEPPED